MQGHDDRDLLLSRHPVQDGQQFQLVPDIQEGGRLVEDDDLRLLTDRPRQQDPLPLSVTDRVKRPLSQMLSVYLRERLVDFALILLREDPETACIRVPPHCRHVAAGHKLSLKPPCEDDSHLLR